MEPAQEKVLKLLSDDGAILKRTRNHDVWKLSDGTSFVAPKTASDTRSWMNCLADLRIRLGLSKRGAIKDVFPVQSKQERYKGKHKTQQTTFLAGLEHLIDGRNFKDLLQDAVYGAKVETPQSGEQVVPYRPRRTRKHTPFQHGEVKQYSPSEINIINQIHRQAGAAGVQIVLNTLHNTQFEINTAHEPNPTTGDEFVNPNTLRKQIDSWKIQVTELKKESEELMTQAATRDKDAQELARMITAAEQFAGALDKTVGIIDNVAQLSSILRNTRGAKADPNKTDGRRSRTKIRYVDEVLAYFESREEPTKLTLKLLHEALVERTGDPKLNPHSLYTALNNYKDVPESKLIKVDREWTHVKFADAFTQNTNNQSSTAATT